MTRLVHLSVSRVPSRTANSIQAMQMAAEINPREAPMAARSDIFKERRLYVPRALRALPLR